MANDDALHYRLSRPNWALMFENWIPAASDRHDDQILGRLRTGTFCSGNTASWTELGRQRRA
jgi:hypothetical protein